MKRLTIFNKYFVNSIKDVQYENKMSVINSKFKFSAINLQDLKTVKKKPDYTKISSNIILDNCGN